MKKFALFVFGTLIFQAINAQEELPEEYRDEVQHFIDCIKKKDITALSELISFPVERAYPIPSIKDAAELKTRFSEVFDDSLIAMITSSDVKQDWSEVGWRGIMLGNGTVWLDTDGTLKRVNYQSAFEVAKEKELIEKDRSSIHSSLQEFKSPVLVMETTKFRIRIDEMADGTYRYASWGIHQLMSEKPDLILTDGNVEMDGSGGNHHFVFKNRNYQYICWVFVLGSSETPDASLEVLAGKKQILRQAAEIIRP